MSDPYNLQRFLDAQADIYDDVLAELRSGRKSSHWMWFIFPQIRGLGHSSTAERFAISSLDEARAYLAHPILGSRLRECTQLVLQIQNRSLDQTFGFPDNLKFRSSITLFLHASAEHQSPAVPPTTANRRAELPTGPSVRTSALSTNLADASANNLSSNHQFFSSALQELCAGQPDPRTVSLLQP